MIYLLFLLFFSYKTISQPVDVPISIPPHFMTMTGDRNCTQLHGCNEFSRGGCNQTCVSKEEDGHSLTYEYTFKGEKFQVYGANKIGHGKYNISLDGEFLVQIDQNQTNETLYALQYDSNIISYGTHTIKITGIGQLYGIYKISFWPSVQAIRVNSIQMPPNWTIEYDPFGGIQEYTSNQNLIKSSIIYGSKIWLYGVNNNGHGNLSITINNEVTIVSQKSTVTILDQLLFEKELTDFQSHVQFKTIGGAAYIHCFYYIPHQDQPKAVPVRNPASSTEPILVSPYTFIRNGNHGCPNDGGNECNYDGTGEVPTYEYVFKGSNSKY